MEEEDVAPETPDNPVEPEEPEGEGAGGDEGEGEQPAADEVDILGDDVPDWMKEFDARDKAFSISKAQLEALPLEAKQAIHNFRKAFTTKSADVAEIRKGALAAAAEAKATKVALDKERAELFEVFKNPAIEKLLKGPEGPPKDPWTEEGAEWHASKKVAELLKQFTDAIKTGADGKMKEWQDHQDRQRIEERRAQLETFRTENPDFDEYIPAIREYRKAHPTVTAEDAYTLLRARAGKKDPVREARSASRHATVRTGSRQGQQVAIEPPAGLSAREKAAWWEANPEAARAMEERIRARR